MTFTVTVLAPTCRLRLPETATTAAASWAVATTVTELVSGATSNEPPLAIEVPLIVIVDRALSLLRARTRTVKV